MAEGLTSWQDIEIFFNTHSILDELIRMENLNGDFRSLAARLGCDIEQSAIESAPKVNRSAHRDFREYYDRDTSSLVESHDFFVADRYGYRSPFS